MVFSPQMRAALTALDRHPAFRSYTDTSELPSATPR